MREMILYIFFFGVAICAFIAIYGNRKKTQAMRRRVQEPTFGNRVNKHNDFSSNERNEFAEENEIIDPVVEGIDGSGIKKSTCVFKADTYQKPSIKPTIEKNEEFGVVEEEQIEEKIEEEIDEEESRRAEKFFPHDLISISILAAPDKPYAGYELLQALLSAGLRFGKMNIFHRFENLNINGRVLFSLASAVKPGIFEMPKMGAFSSPALVLFMRVSTQKDAMAAFDLMISTAQQLIEDLGGEVLDGQRQPLTDETIAEFQAKLTDYQKSKNASEIIA